MKKVLLYVAIVLIAVICNHNSIQCEPKLYPNGKMVKDSIWTANPGVDDSGKWKMYIEFWRDSANCVNASRKCDSRFDKEFKPLLYSVTDTVRCLKYDSVGNTMYDVNIVWEMGLPRFGFYIDAYGNNKEVQYFDYNYLPPTDRININLPMVFDSVFAWGYYKDTEVRIIDALTGDVILSKYLSALPSEWKYQIMPNGKDISRFIVDTNDFLDIDISHIGPGIYLIGIFDDDDEAVYVKTLQK